MASDVHSAVESTYLSVGLPEPEGHANARDVPLEILEKTRREGYRFVVKTPSQSQMDYRIKYWRYYTHDELCTDYKSEEVLSEKLGGLLDASRESGLWHTALTTFNEEKATTFRFRSHPSIDAHNDGAMIKKRTEGDPRMVYINEKEVRTDGIHSYCVEFAGIPSHAYVAGFGFVFTGDPSADRRVGQPGFKSLYVQCDGQFYVYHSKGHGADRSSPGYHRIKAKMNPISVSDQLLIWQMDLALGVCKAWYKKKDAPVEDRFNPPPDAVEIFFQPLYPPGDRDGLRRGCAAALIREAGISVHVTGYSSPQEGLLCCSWVSNWFQKHGLFQTLFDAAKEKFELFDEDEPQMIQTAIQDEAFIGLLESYFRSGDTVNSKHFKTLATLSGLCGGKSLFHHCCENNYLQCVDLLLCVYSRNQFRLKKPWLLLCDPLWRDRHNYDNTAFHIAVYRGHLELVRALFKWARDNEET